MGTYISHTNDYYAFTPIGKSVLIEVNEHIGEIEFGVAIISLFLWLCLTAPSTFLVYFLTVEDSPLTTLLTVGSIVGLIMLVPVTWYFRRKRRSVYAMLNTLLLEHRGFYPELCCAEDEQIPISVVYDQSDKKVETDYLLYFLHQMMRTETKR